VTGGADSKQEVL
jgi:hypothetical protein